MSFGRRDRNQRTSAAAPARISQRRTPAPATTPQGGLLKDQATKVQKATATRDPTPTAKGEHSTRPTQGGYTTTTPQGQSPNTAKGRPPTRTTQRRHTASASERHTASATKTHQLMLLNHLYSIDHFGATTATLRLNAAHPIFGGHFPGNPILPGACQLQIIREMLSGITGKDYRLQKATTIKFITPIDPRQHGTIRLDLQYQEEKNTALRVTATFTAGETICLKFNGTFLAG